MRKVVIYDLFDNNSLGINKTIAHKTFKRPAEFPSGVFSRCRVCRSLLSVVNLRGY
jgi:hypothetical protein